MRRALCVLGLALAVGAGAPAWAEEMATVQVVLRNHRFEPAEVHVASGRPVMLEVSNLDATADEFDSGVLAIEKLIAPGGKVRIRLRPMAPGRYAFMGEFHPDTAQGAIIADPAR